MLNFLKKIFRPKLQPMNKILIYKENILFNMWYLQWLKLGAEIFPVLKSNAYGHWLKEITQILESYWNEYLVVDSLSEFFLTKKYTSKKFLLLWETNPANYLKLDNGKVTLAIYNISTLKYLLNSGRKFVIHLFINTGMNREWIQHQDLLTFLEVLKKHENSKNIKVEWVMSHLHSAEVEAHYSIQEQINEFKVMYYKIIDYWHNIRYRHIGNSAWTLTIEDDFFNAWRPWISLYGHNPLPENHSKFDIWDKLKPAMRITSKIVSLQHIQKWDVVSYNWTFIAKHKTTIASVPFGYKEWLPRILSNNIVFYHKDQEFNQVGNICMNFCSLAIGKEDIKLYDDIELLSNDKSRKNSAKEISDQAWMLVYEFLVHIDSTLRREVVE